MTEFKIDKNIPIPKMKMPNSEKYLFLTKLKIGDSIFFSVDAIIATYGKNYRSRISYQARLLNVTLAFRSFPEDNGVRIWRVKPS